MSLLDALADPIRLRIVRYLARGEPASLPQLAEAAGVHRNTARPHVAQLERAGLLVRTEATPSGRGRPPVRYRLEEGWRPPISDLQGLAELLAAALTKARPSERQLRRVGEDFGRHLLGQPGGRDVERELPKALERLGFQAELRSRRLHLSGCPCPLVAPHQPELLCGLVAAVADGVLAGAGGEVRVEDRRSDPDRRLCDLSLGKPRRRRGARSRI